jgi:hypothetical protein
MQRLVRVTALSSHLLLLSYPNASWLAVDADSEQRTSAVSHPMRQLNRSGTFLLTPSALSLQIPSPFPNTLTITLQGNPSEV